MRPLRLRNLGLTALAASALAVGGTGSAPAQTSLSDQQAAAASLKSRVAAESARIAATSAGLADAERRLNALEARVAQRQAQLKRAQDELVRARVRLTKLQTRAAAASRTLSANLVDSYKSGTPSIVNVVLNANGFPDLINRLSFFKRVSKRNATILDTVRTARQEVARQEAALKDRRAQLDTLAAAAVSDREQAGVIRNALLSRQADQIQARNGTAGELRTVQSRIGRIQAAQAAAARRARAAATATAEAPTPPPSPSPSPSPSSSTTPAPSPSSSDTSGAVAKVIAAANEIATTPYVYGGGHGGSSGGYDCSGSLSYALAAAGLVSGPLTSGGFMSWGEAGPGAHITVYTNPGHAFMIVDGRRFDTSALSGGGTRWTSESRSTAGFVARHPPGL